MTDIIKAQYAHFSVKGRSLYYAKKVYSDKHNDYITERDETGAPIYQRITLEQAAILLNMMVQS